MFANNPPPELTKSAMTSAFDVNTDSTAAGLPQLSGIHITAGLSVFILEKNVVTSDAEL